MITGYEFALLTIFIGYGVGLAVRWGSNGRGGRAYQTLAIVLTYLAIVTSYAPAVVRGLKADAKTQKVAAATTAPMPAAPPETGRPSVGTLALGVAAITLIVCLAPIPGRHQ